MSFFYQLNSIVYKRRHSFAYKGFWDKLHIDYPLLFAVFTLLVFGLFVLFSATNGNLTKISSQLVRIGIGILMMVAIAQVHPKQFKRWTPVLFWSGIALLVLVKLTGYVGKGAQRWIDIGIFKFQPSEIMKYAVPMMISLQLSKRPLPPSFTYCSLVSILIFIPCILIFKQPDLGTAILILFSGATCFILAGLSSKQIALTTISGILTAPILWQFLHDYQKSRILTFLNPERDPLGSGYHIIQSKIAIGSGGLLGKGWLNGSQSHLEYLPESSTDFIFALSAEEFGLVGSMLIIGLFAFITCRILYLSQHNSDTYSRLLSGTLGITLFLYVLINIGMVSGIFPVVGIPLPLISYGGTSMLTVMVCFGIIMSMNSHRKLAHEG